MVSLMLTICGTSVMAQGVPTPQPVAADTQVGVYYFPGWSAPEKWYCLKASDTAIQPLLGYYPEGDPEVADWHIKWALEHGVSFFAFDHYVRGGGEMLETALVDGFMQAEHIGQFQFCLNWCNHAPAETQTLEELEAFEDVVIEKYLTHPSYLRKDGKAVVMILSGYSFVKTLGIDGAKAAFDAFDQRCRDAGLEGLYLVFCEGGINGEQAIKDSFAAGVDAFCLYNYPYAGTDYTGPGEYGEAPYADLLAQCQGLSSHWGNLTEARFWPTVMSGWDRRPWTKDRDLVRTGTTPELFGEQLRTAKGHVNADNIVMIEAWNEWGEGSVLEPSVEWGFEYLEKVREVFSDDGRRLSSRDDKPHYDVELPVVSDWRFDTGPVQWGRSACAEPTIEWGKLVTTSESDDPQLTSPPTYLDCAEYGSMRLRMRLTGEGDARTATGQLFWETVEMRMRAETSVLFDVEVDGRWHEYEVDLTEAPAWRGMTDRLRLDPVNEPGVKIEIDRLRILRK